MSRRALGGLAGVLLVAMVLVGVLVGGSVGLVWLKRHLDPAPIRVETEPQTLRPWPPPLDLVVERAIVGSPMMSIETCPPIERLYILLRAQGLEAEQVAELASAHLSSLGWRMVPHTNVRVGAWIDFQGVKPDSSDGSVYVGPLVDYVGDSSWTADDRGGADLLLRLAPERHDNLAVVQIFAGDDDGDC